MVEAIQEALERTNQELNQANRKLPECWKDFFIYLREREIERSKTVIWPLLKRIWSIARWSGVNISYSDFLEQVYPSPTQDEVLAYREEAKAEFGFQV